MRTLEFRDRQIHGDTQTHRNTRSGESPVPAVLARTIEAYMIEHPTAAVLEDGRVVFDMRAARYSVADFRGRCVVELWSEERNLIRTVVEIQQRSQSLRLMTRRMGAPRTQTLELVPSNDRRTPTSRESGRRNYQRLLERALSRAFIGYKVGGLRSAMDIEHSFGPAYVRGHLMKGTTAEAVIGVSQAESSATINGILTLGLLWLDYCRRHGDGRRHFGVLKVIVPQGEWRTTAERMAWLNHGAADFQLLMLDERSEELEPVDFRDTGNAGARLVHAFSAEAAIERCQDGLDRLIALLPPGATDRIEVCAGSPTEVGLRLHGLEFARVRHGVVRNSFAHENEVTFGAGQNETPLSEENAGLARELFARLFLSRCPEGSHNDPLFRLQPERWLEARLRERIRELLPALRQDVLYTQVPALASGDRGLLDMLTLDRAGRLTVVELKADEDLHLPMQALDYWIRVRALNNDRQPASGGGWPLSAFERQGYFPGAEVSTAPPRLLLAAPALRIHPANDTVLRYLSPQIEWELVALGEHWRRELKVVFRKHSA